MELPNSAGGREQSLLFDLPPSVDDELVELLTTFVCPARLLTTAKTEEFVESLSDSWATVALSCARLVEHSRLQQDGVPAKPTAFDDLEFDDKPSIGQIDAALFAIGRLPPKMQEQIQTRLDRLFTRAKVMKKASVFFSPAYGLGAYYRWMLGAHLFATLTGNAPNTRWLIPKLHASSFRTRADPCAKWMCQREDHENPPFLDALLGAIAQHAESTDSDASFERDFIDRAFFSSFDAPRRFIEWLRTGAPSPSTNFQLLRRTEFYRNAKRDRFIEQLISELPVDDPYKPLLVVEAPNSLNGLTAFAGRLQELAYESKLPFNTSVLYIRANRFEAEDCHKSLAYYVGVILSWLDGKDVRSPPPFRSRLGIYEGMARIRRAMSIHRLLFIVDGMESDRGAFEDVLNIINDNPINELISNLVTPATQDVTLASQVRALEVPATLSRVLILSGGRWNKYSGIIRFKGMLPPISREVVPPVLREHGFANPDLVTEVLGNSLCPETEAALLDVLVSIDGGHGLTAQQRERARLAATTGSPVGRMELFKLAKTLLAEKDPFALLMARFVALCPGGLRYSTMTRCLRDFSSPLCAQWDTATLMERFNAASKQYPMLFVTGDDEIVESDTFLLGRQQWETDGPRTANDNRLDDESGVRWREPSIDIRFAEVRELLVADIIQADINLWFRIHHLFAEESLDQWTDSVRIAAPAELSSIGLHRRLIQAVWHGLQSISFDEEPQVERTELRARRSSFPISPDKRYIYIVTYLMRRCLEGDEEWLLARGFARHRLRVCLLAAANSPEKVRDYLAQQYLHRPCSCNETTTTGTEHLESWHGYFDRFAIQRPVVCRLRRVNTLGPEEKTRLFADHLISLGRAALDSGHGVLAKKTLSTLDDLNALSPLATYSSDLAISRNKLSLDQLEYADQAMDALDQMSEQLVDFGLPNDFPAREIFAPYDYPAAPFPFAALVEKAGGDAQTFRDRSKRDRLPQCVSILLRYAEALALKADAIPGESNLHRNRLQYPAFLQAAYVYFFAERLRLILRYDSPSSGDLSAKPTRYQVRVSLKLSGLCYTATRAVGAGGTTPEWRAAAQSFWLQAEHGADIYTRRFFRYDYDRAYMNVLGASFERKRASMIRLFNDSIGVEQATNVCFARAFKHLQIADIILSRLGYPLSPTRRFILERIKTYCAVGTWAGTALSHGSLASNVPSKQALSRMTKKSLASARADIELLNNLINTPEAFAAESVTRGSLFWNRLMELQRQKVDQLAATVSSLSPS
ncbi:MULTISPECIES: hypothetical protein [unclassified Caballeronia]|uniref:hypothetical protein n=1 Tax=unclassified Caballeronia TaxID=2646786 RepID=UPI002028BF07|nr:MULTISPECIES: hypothetical protein [unclassified Caballeronia]MDR5768085.1 hypothetical protein [Caballeronia sp. LZ028]